MSNTISMDKKYKYRNGEPARVLCIDSSGLYPVISLDPEGYTIKHISTGHFYGIDRMNAFDLIEVKEEKTLWLNVYPADYGLPDCVHGSKNAADLAAADGRIARIKITFTEGQFDE